MIAITILNVTYFEKDGIKYQSYYQNGILRTRKYIDNKKISKDKEPVYKEWRYMRKRCQTKNAPYSRYYYKKGIKVCEEWNSLENGFDTFYKWAIKNGYEEGLSIDRIDSSKGYCPSNCRWIELNENRRLGISQKHIPKWEYKAYNINQQLLLIFNRADDFSEFTGVDSRRVSDGCKDLNYTYKGWKFERKAINLDYYEGQETIPTGSTLEDELPAEVRIIHLPIRMDEDIVHTT